MMTALVPKTEQSSVRVKSGQIYTEPSIIVHIEKKQEICLTATVIEQVP